MDTSRLIPMAKNDKAYKPYRIGNSIRVSIPATYYTFTGLDRESTRFVMYYDPESGALVAFPQERVYSEPDS